MEISGLKMLCPADKADVSFWLVETRTLDLPPNGPVSQNHFSVPPVTRSRIPELQLICERTQKASLCTGCLPSLAACEMKTAQCPVRVKTMESTVLEKMLLKLLVRQGFPVSAPVNRHVRPFL